jgi:CheY-like chemotaxis protein
MSSLWPSDSHALVVDDDDVYSDAIALQLEQAGCVCHNASSYEDAVRELRRKSAIKVVILDHAAVSARIDKVVESLRAIRPSLMIVGNSGAERRSDFASAGVSRYLQKPWRVEQLVSLVSERISSCGGCGLPLPLRRPREGEVGGHWACAFCGSRYSALRDEDARPEILLNARQDEEL